MAKLYSQELIGPLNSVPAKPAKGSRIGARMRRYSATIPLAGQTTADTIVIAKVPAGSSFAFGMIKSSIGLGTATIAVGAAGDTGRYRAAATQTSTAVSFFSKESAAGDGGELADEEEVFLTIGAAALPGSGTLLVDMYFSHG